MGVSVEVFSFGFHRIKINFCFPQTGHGELAVFSPLRHSRKAGPRGVPHAYPRSSSGKNGRQSFLMSYSEFSRVSLPPSRFASGQRTSSNLSVTSDGRAR